MSSDESSGSYISCSEEEPSSTRSTIRGHLVLGVGISVDAYRMKVNAGQSRIKCLSHGKDELPCESLKECVATVLKPKALGIAGVKHDWLVFFEVNFYSQESLESLCKSLHTDFQKSLKDLLKCRFSLDTKIDVNTELYLYLSNGTGTDYLVDGPVFKLEVLQPTDRVFSIDDLAELLKHLTKATVHWFNVGLFLNIGYARLKTIRLDYPHSQQDCLREMLAMWLNKTEDASPWKIVFALKESKVVEVAYEFASKYDVSLKEVTEYEKLMAEGMEGLDAKERRFFQLNVEFSKLEEKEKSISAQMEYLASEQKKLRMECEKKDSNHAWLKSLVKTTVDEEARKVLDGLIAENDTTESKEKLDKIKEDIKKLTQEGEQIKGRLSNLEHQESSMRNSQGTNGSYERSGGDRGGTVIEIKPDNKPTKFEEKLEELKQQQETKSHEMQGKLETLISTAHEILSILKEKDFKVVQVSQPGECKQQ